MDFKNIVKHSELISKPQSVNVIRNNLFRIRPFFTVDYKIRLQIYEGLTRKYIHPVVDILDVELNTSKSLENTPKKNLDFEKKKGDEQFLIKHEVEPQFEDFIEVLMILSSDIMPKNKYELNYISDYRIADGLEISFTSFTEYLTDEANSLARLYGLGTDNPNYSTSLGFTIPDYFYK